MSSTAEKLHKAAVERRWFIQQHPVISQRENMRVPFAVYKCHTRVIYGIGDVTRLREISAPHGWYPVTDGKGHGFVVVWVNRFEVTSLKGPYDSVAFFFVVTNTDDDAHALFPADVTSQPYSAVLPAFNPCFSLFNLRYFVSANGKDADAADAIEYGKKVLNQDKQPGSDYGFEFGLNDFDSSLFQFKFPPPYQRGVAASERERASAFFELGRLVGWRQTADIMLRSKLGLSAESNQIIVPYKNTVSAWHTEFVFDPTFSRIKKDQLTVKDGRQKNELRDVGFSPQIVADDPDLVAVTYPEEFLNAVDISDFHREVEQVRSQVPRGTTVSVTNVAARKVKVMNGKGGPVEAIVDGPNKLRAVWADQQQELSQLVCQEQVG